MQTARALAAATGALESDSAIQNHPAGEKGDRIMLCSYSNLNAGNLEEIKALEKEIGATLLSFTCRDISPTKIDETTLGKIKKLESRLGVALVAVKG
ncbi:MAG TPA: hypothetical protein PLR20_07665 [Syntrophales bacterium]|jgi:hypothetical protein|nr:hypothetical protein [Syntrophales bacterium]HOX93336.1 hypothetical protein [Syntrophales bacterium]HPI56537.1 hypothetical protein [Syntrophales bacterium]HPN25042.1 hypothetical protein [Syntrophales bacterium]HQM29215.1 hypothetical protein [Syntrophales bacterium]